jgi:hypothetical protein
MELQSAHHPCDDPLRFDARNIYGFLKKAEQIRENPNVSQSCIDKLTAPTYALINK